MRISDTRFTSSLKKFHLYFKNVLYLEGIFFFSLYIFISSIISRLISGITFHDKYFKDKDVQMRPLDNFTLVHSCTAIL